DTLPPMTGQTVTSHALDPNGIQENDILSLLSFYENGVDAKLVSKLLAFEDGKFVARWVRIPKTRLPDSSKKGDHFRIRNGKFEPILMDARKLRAYTKLRSLRKRHANDPKPATPIEFENVFQSRLAELRNMGLLKKS